MDTILILIIICLIAIIVFLFRKWNKSKIADAEKTAMLHKYSGIIDAENEVRRIKEEAELLLETAMLNKNSIIESAENESSHIKEKAKQLLDDTNYTILSMQSEIDELRKSYSNKKSIYDQLEKEISIYKEDLNFMNMGVFEPHFDFDTSEEFKDEIKNNKNQQKALLRIKNSSGAIWCSTEWTVGNSRSEGKKMTNRSINLTARAFNGECDASISNCTFKNWETMRDRIIDSFNKINNLNEVNAIYISKKYLELKLQELELVHAYKMKKQLEKEEQREIRAQMAEEKKAQQEIEKAIKEAEVEELRVQKALEKARKEMEDKFSQLNAEQIESYKNKIDQLQEALKEAEIKGQKALSMAQQTKRGYVYIISNLGSFGDNVFKIGMTRRLVPEDRIDELGSASVPFLFDIHAMISCEDAPALENALHQHFDNKRTNLINRRKEFFNVSLKEIKEEVKKIVGDDVDFIETFVAQHYNQTLALRKKNNENIEVNDLQKANTPRFAESI